MIPGICWQEFYTTNQIQSNALINAGFKALRIFFNLRDLPRKSESTSWPGYIQYLFNTMPNGMHTFTFEGHASVNTTTEPMRMPFDFCKKYKWLPIVCMGTSEENVSGEWISRVPVDWNWIGRFTKEFAIYLHNTMGFDRADLEVFNEPTKIWGSDYKSYCAVAYVMGSNWKTVSNYKLSVFNDDLLRQSFLDGILTDVKLMAITDYIGTHCGLGSEDSEWDDKLIEKTTAKIKAKYPHLEQALTEMSLNGIWSRLNQLPGNVAMYGIIGAIRNKEFGTATRIDDLWLYGPGNDFQITSQEKVNIITKFNHDNYKPYILESEDMEFFKNTTELKKSSKGMDVKLLQKVANKALSLAIPLGIDGNWGPLTDKAIISLNKFYDFVIRPEVIDWKRFMFYVGMYPEIFDQIQCSYYKGER